MTVRPVVVTGASGFVGRALTWDLTNRGTPVRALSRGPVRADQQGPISLERIAVDYGDDVALARAFAGAGSVVHLVALTHTRRSPRGDDMDAYRAVNVELTKRVLETAIRANVRTFVLLSSIKAVGDASAPGDALTERHVRAPTDAYGRSKAEAEDLVLEVAATAGMRTVILRPPIIHGPGARGNLLSLMRAARWRVPLPFGLARNERSTIGLSNLSDVVMAAIDAEGRGGVYHIADDGTMSTRMLYERILVAMGHRPWLPRVPTAALRIAATALGRADDIERLLGDLVVDCALFRTAFDWTPTTPTNESLDAMVAAYLRVR